MMTVTEPSISLLIEYSNIKSKVEYSVCLPVITDGICIFYLPLLHPLTASLYGDESILHRLIGSI